MTLLNIINIVILLILAGVTFASYRHMRKKTAEAEGLGSVNERGEIGTSDEGDIISEA